MTRRRSTAKAEWSEGIAALVQDQPRLAERVQQVASHVTSELHNLDTAILPSTVIHGDFTSWNVHYDELGKVIGVVDFALTHVDSRAYELAIARAYRAPEMLRAYEAELERIEWPFSGIEESSIPLIYRSFRLDMIGAELLDGARSGHFNSSMIERQLRHIEDSWAVTNS